MAPRRLAATQRTHASALLAALAACAPSTSEAAVSGYTFATSSPAYAEITGGTLHVGTGNAADDLSFDAVPIGFTFRYDGVDYTSVSISTNGYIRFGSTTLPGDYLPISSSNAAMSNTVCPLGRHNVNRTSAPTGNLRSQTTGSPGSQLFIVQWKSFRAFGTGSASVLNFQAVLEEGTNRVIFRYGGSTPGTTAGGTAEVGLKGATNADFLNLTNTVWNNVTPNLGSSATDTMPVGISSSTVPFGGVEYAFTPPVSAVGDWTLFE